MERLMEWVKVGPHKEVEVDSEGRLRNGETLIRYLARSVADRNSHVTRMSSAAGAESEHHMNQAAGVRYVP